MSPRELYEAFAGKYPLPPHLLFDSEAGQNDDGYLSDADFNLLFGRADGSDDREDIAAFVLCLGASGTVFYECGFFRCESLAGAREVEGLCLLRCETVRRMRARITFDAGYGFGIKSIAPSVRHSTSASLSEVITMTGKRE